MGTSYGGFASVALATFYPSSVQCSASLNGGGDLRSFAKLVPERRPDMAEDIHKEVGDVTAPDDLDRILAQSPAEHLDGSTVPFLIEYGALDKISAPEQSTGFIERLARANHAYVSVQYPDQGHTLSTQQAKAFHFRLLRKWLARCTANPSADLPAAPAGTAVVTGDPLLLRALDVR